MMEPVKKPTYPQKWHEYNLAQTNEKAHFQTFLYELCQQVGEMPRKPGAGRNRLPLSDMLFAAAFKVYNTVSARRFMSDLREAFRRGLISKTPHFNSIFNYLELEELTDVLKRLIIESSLPLKAVESDFAVDSSGFSTGIYKRWAEAKWGRPRIEFGDKAPFAINKRDWIKVHLMCGVKTNIVTSVEISNAHAGDSLFFKPLVETTAQNFKLRDVSADKAYSAEANMHLVLIHGGEPYIAFRKNATAHNRRSGSVWKRLFLEYQINQEYFMEHYHKRSNAESTFYMIKAKFGERLRSKTHTAQVNEVLCKILCHNLCCVIQSMYELGVDVNFCAESSPAQKSGF